MLHAKILKMNKRKHYLLGLIVSALLLGSVYYFQYARHMAPCPLCIMQRVAYYLLGITCLVALWQNPRITGQRIYAILLLIFSAYGIGLAIRQLYLQSLPFGQAPACAPSLNFMLKNFPLHETLTAMFYGSGDCAVVHWQFLGLSMAGWSLVFLVGFFIAGLLLLVKAGSKKG